MRIFGLGICVSALSLSLVGCSVSNPVNLINDPMRVQSFTPGPGGSFQYSVHTNTVMTENEDGAAEQIRRDWLAQTLHAQGRCPQGYVIYNRWLVIPPQRAAYSPPPDELTFGNGGEVVYNGACLST
jgi:hypothetical protein